MAASNLVVRFLTAVVAIPLMMALLYVGPPWGWLVFVCVAAAVGAWELFDMTHGGDKVAMVFGIGLTEAVVLALWFGIDDARVLLGLVLGLPIVSQFFNLWRLGDIATAATRMAATSFGPLWIGGGLGAIALLRTQGEGIEGPSYVVMSLGLAWLGDTGAYFAGRAFGKHKLYASVSPKKTIEGAIGGVFTAAAGTVGLRFLLLPSMPILDAALLGAVGSAMGAAGDLGESLLKRSTGVKDSGGIVPGHGGILDRVDAVLITAPVLLVYLLFIR